MRDAVFTLMANGCLGVPARVVEELDEHYNDEFRALQNLAVARLRPGPAAHLAIADFADAVPDGFTPTVYDNSDYAVGGIALDSQIRIYTVQNRINFYAAAFQNAGVGHDVRDVMFLTPCANCR
ncbi:hypothetical protein [Falsiroseomonas oryziterrae]|uniref:hypothetical protein n=1 Tax=Falsiroseomonas oryziterrae TaxID=2911368 RepID=UPI001F27137E|nr:hypothetical protein [Roseomonas sp. NPKOSM-4]